jgi:hypothetical protein
MKSSGSGDVKIGSLSGAASGTLLPVPDGDSTLLAHYEVMARYNGWMNEKLYGLCEGLPDDTRKRDMGAFFRSVHGTLNHILLADHA